MKAPTELARRGLTVAAAPAVLTCAFVAALLTGCAAPAENGSPKSPSPPLTGKPARDVWVVAADDAVPPPVSRTLLRSNERSILIGEKAPAPEPERPRVKGRVDVRFHKAELDNALRFLAEAGRFNLVVESGLTGQVTAELRSVDPYDALVSIAEANGATVRFRRGIVSVTRATGNGPSATHVTP